MLPITSSWREGGRKEGIVISLSPGQGIVCSEEIIRFRIFIRDSLFTLHSVQYAYYTSVLCVWVGARARVCVYVCMYVCMYVCTYFF
jgi:hypothetical protein